MKLNPNWVPLDGAGHRVHVDVKTNDVKRVVSSRLCKQETGGAILRGEAATQEFRKPLYGHAAEFERLLGLGISHDPDKKYVMDVSKVIDSEFASLIHC